MAITLPRDAAKGFHRTPLTWRPLLLTGGPVTRVTATAVCARRHFASLEDHEIGADGTVSPSVECPELGCGWHENVTLEGWPP